MNAIVKLLAVTCGLLSLCNASVINPRPSTSCQILEESKRVDCGFVGIDESACLSKGCCWNPAVSSTNTPWCYHAKDSGSGCDATHAGNCYKVFAIDLKFWRDAQKACREWGGHLTDITSSAEQTAITDMLRAWLKDHQAAQMWIGANDIEREGRFVWAETGQTLSYTNWYRFEPNNSRGVEDCVSVFLGGKYPLGQWNDLPCEECGLPYICEKRILSQIGNNPV